MSHVFMCACETVAARIMTRRTIREIEKSHLLIIYDQSESEAEVTADETSGDPKPSTIFLGQELRPC